MIGSRARGRLNDHAVPGKRWDGCHDLTGPRALVCVAGEMRKRDAARTARAARRRASWLFRLVSRAQDWRARTFRCQECPISGQGRRRFGRASGLPVGRELPVGLEQTEADHLANVYEALTAAQLVARQAGQCDLADALHALFLLDMTGNIADAAPLVAAARKGLQTALGDDPRVN